MNECFPGASLITLFRPLAGCSLPFGVPFFRPLMRKICLAALRPMNDVAKVSQNKQACNRTMTVFGLPRLWYFAPSGILPSLVSGTRRLLKIKSLKSQCVCRIGDKCLYLPY
jgi:hypothetical protein